MTEPLTVAFGRRIEFDSHSRDFPVRNLVYTSNEPVSVLWACDLFLNQGREGMCLGAAAAHELAAEPFPVSNLTLDFAREQLYWPAQRLDQYPGGAFPGADPYAEGTSVLAVAKRVKLLGYISNYYWSFSLAELVLGLQQGPAIVGTYWYRGMMNPDAEGFAHVSGERTGGHGYLVRGVNIEKGYFIIRNSWGRMWGRLGDCYISFSDMEILLHQDGEACFFVGRQIVPMLGGRSRWQRFLDWFR